MIKWEPISFNVDIYQIHKFIIDIIQPEYCQVNVVLDFGARLDLSHVDPHFPFDFNNR